MKLKIFVSLKHKPEEYIVKLRIYDDNGKLVDSKEYEGVKQLVIRARETRISRQLAPEPYTLVIDVEKPRIELKENTLLYIEG